MADRTRWTSYNNWNPRGPYLLIIIDWEWWEESHSQIQAWFDRNCPECKPEPGDTIIRFNDQSQHTMWNLAWSS